MADKYRYSIPLSSLFNEEEPVVEAPSGGMVPRPVPQQEAPTKEEYDPMGYLPDYSSLVKSYFTKDEAEKVDAFPDAPRVRTSAIDEVLSEMDMLAFDSAMDASADRNEMDVTGSLGSGATVSSVRPQEAPPRLSRGVSLRPKLRPTPEAPAIDTAAIEAAIENLLGGSTETSKGEGLMSRKLDGKDGDVAKSYNDTIISSFVDMMGELEGTEDHGAQEGQFTYGYGVLPATADSLGINPQDYDNRRDFATVVYGKMRDNAKEQYGDVFNGMSAEDQKSVLSLYINLGRLPTGVVDALSGEEKDFLAAGDSLVNVVHYTDRKTNKKYASKGLSKRRASEWNSLMQGREDFTPVVAVDVVGSKKEPTFRWLDANGGVVRDFTSSKPLSPSNSMKRIAL